MPEIDLKLILDNFGKGLEGYCRQQGIQYLEQAKSDGVQFANQLKTDLTAWAKAVAAGKMSKDDLEFLIRGKQDLAEMTELTEAGLAAIQLDALKKAAVTLLADAVVKALPA